ncbi:zf-HC2 domain-containing protein [Moraxella bovis]
MTELMSLSQEEPLTLSQKMTVKFHLLMCPACRRFDDNNRVLKEMIKQHKNLKG